MCSKSLIEWIEEAEDDEITQIAEALLKRQKVLHPDWEGMLLSFPVKRYEECKQIMLAAWEVLRKIMDNQVENMT